MFISNRILHVSDRWLHLLVLPSQAAALLWRLVGFHLTAGSGQILKKTTPSHTTNGIQWTNSILNQLESHRIASIWTSTHCPQAAQEPGALHCYDHVGEKIAPKPVLYSDGHGPHGWNIGTSLENKVATAPCLGKSLANPWNPVSWKSLGGHSWPWSPHQIQRFIHGLKGQVQPDNRVSHPLNMLFISGLQTRLPNV